MDREIADRMRRNLLFLIAGLLVISASAHADQVEGTWRFVNEGKTEFAEAQQQGRAYIYRGDHMLALRCHHEGEREWLTLLFSATWFIKPEESLALSFSVDGAPPTEIVFTRETDYRFVAGEPPTALLQALADGSYVTVGGKDYEGPEVVMPLKGSRYAMQQAFGICGFDPLERNTG